ncbi:MAG TPA: type II secretion system F family protein [Nocardioidaceae bacterium]|nr:type II secretion system F family protein [Nocardioidaceae bacterium]
MGAHLLLIIGITTVFVALVLALSIIGVATTEQRGVGRSLAAIRALNAAPESMREELERPFNERVLAPMGQRLVGIGRRLTGADSAARIRRRLDIAGNPRGWEVDRVIGTKVLAAGVLGGVAFGFLVLNAASLTTVVVATGALTLFGFVLPNVLLYNAGSKREKLIRTALPDALDLLTISVEAGLAFDAAVGRVAQSTDGPLAQEFSRVLQEMQIGVARMDAMRALGERSSIPELRGFVTAMVQAEAFGVPIGKVLRVQSGEMRLKRRQRAEEKAQQVPVKILFPLMLFILPTLFLVVLGPAVISSMEAFSRT